MLDYLFEKEKSQFACWLPILVSIGILLNLKGLEINLSLLVPIIFILSFLLYFWSNIPNYCRLFVISLISILLGLLAMEVRYKTINSPIIPFDNKFYTITGIVNNIIPLENGYRVILSNVSIKKLDLEETPQKIRLTVKTELNNAKIGNLVKVNAILNKPMQPYLPESYNFARDAYFKGIGAVGYTVSEFTILSEENKSLIGNINSLRADIQNRVNSAIGTYYGSIATALMINEYSNIDKKVLKDLRATGLAHILSVSGMHLSLVAAIFFISTRFLLNCFGSLALHVHVKKIAAAVSLLGSLCYLLISGMEVAAIRSFIMASMVIIAILIDRASNPMRAIAWAATVILLITPENIIHPSFQMSFAAVLALISCYEFLTRLNFDFSEFNLIQKILFYFFSVAFSSLIASLATAPFALYHFGQSSNYTILANLLAVPITTFCLMPLVVLTFLLYPLHLEIIALYPMKQGISLLLRISEYIAELPHAVAHFAKITDYNLLIIVFGMLWFCIWISKIRFLGIFIILTGIISQSFVKKPDIFVDWERKIFAVLTQENQLVFLTKSLTKFKKQLLMNQLGTSVAQKYTDELSDKLKCHENICFYYQNKFYTKFDINNNLVEIYKENILQNKYNKNKGTDLLFLK